MTIDECEMAILHHAVDETDHIQKTKIANNEDVKKLIEILEDFLRRTKCVCYGGTAINAILPEEAKFYDKSVEIPDYDFFSIRPIEHARELTQIYYKAGFTETEAKSGIHKGTYKVFVNYIPAADITLLPRQIFSAIQKDSIVVDGIHYAPPNYLRMGMFLELSRPAGDVSRWEKVLKRLTLLNKYHPMKSPYNCRLREVEEPANYGRRKQVFDTIRESLVDQGAVFFGGYAASLYSHYAKDPVAEEKPPSMDVIIENPKKSATIIAERLRSIGVKNIQVIRHPRMEDVLTEHYQIKIGKTTVLILFQPIACYNYNVITLGKHKVRVATIDTMLSFYLVFVYSGLSHFDVERILCMAQMLFDIEEENRTNQKGLLKRFSIDCYGEQGTLSTIRSEKSDKFKELKERGVQIGSNEWNEWFFKYNPAEEKETKGQTPKGQMPKGQMPKGQMPKGQTPKGETPTQSRKPYQYNLYDKPRKNRTQRKRRPLSLRSLFTGRRSRRNTFF
jgi:hypothetical protein